ncbi:fas-associated protein [Anaeramoeba flamelloides]|uniref:Fas-associated protein n=1 Tax=Anaeramoeba flamelloides TaxID=1746091 RepID=A0AAV7YIJ5_9EUKA|nr:fas-associated protein [Anaeramoeba flamelloides]
MTDFFQESDFQKENENEKEKEKEKEKDNIFIEEEEEKLSNKEKQKETKNSSNDQKPIIEHSKRKTSFFSNIFQNLKTILTPLSENVKSTFLTEFEDSFGLDHPTFYQGTYKEAFRFAKESSKFFVVYLHSSDHTSTSDFCLRVLTDENIIAFVNENFIFWGESIKHPSGFLLTNKFFVTTYPFMAVVSTNTRTRSQVVKIFEGQINADQLMTGLISALEENASAISEQRIQENERSSIRQIREQQDREYQESIERDQERQRIEFEQEQQQRIERMEREEKIKRKKEKKERQMLELEEKIQNLKPEPDPKTEEGVIRLRVILPDGDKISRCFKKDWEMKTIFDWVDINSNKSLKPNKYYLVKNYPKTSFSDKNATFEDAKIENGDSLMAIKK